MIPKLIEVPSELIFARAYIWDVNWVSCLWGIY